MARNKKADKTAVERPFFKRHAPILGDIVFGVGIAALISSFDEIARLDLDALGNDKFVILFAIGFIVSGAILRRERR
ncbi:MAG: hypothetical protein LBN32_02190 [Helicobacteraceae bacterium]|nr:hypothetical protein [Helicobacteraceae bacterium]